VGRMAGMGKTMDVLKVFMVKPKLRGRLGRRRVTWGLYVRIWLTGDVCLRVWACGGLLWPR